MASHALKQIRKKMLLDELKVTRSLQRGKEIHAEAQQSGSHSCCYFSTALIKMYAKCGSMADARQVFDSISCPDVVSWTVLILGYADNRQGDTALGLFAKMKALGVAPNPFTIVAALRACSALALNGHGKAECLEQAKLIHSSIGSHSDMHVQATLIRLYTKLQSIEDAHRVFTSMEKPDVISWTALIMGYADKGEGFPALNLFARMRFQGCAPDSVTFSAALKACSCLALDESGRKECLEVGREIHSQIDCPLNIYVQSSLIDMYSKCGSMDEAQQVFDGVKHPNMVSWTALIMGYAENGKSAFALDLFAKMRSQGCAPDCVTYAAVLKACSLLGALETGRKIHAQIDPRMEYSPNLVTSLVDFYSKCGSMVEAQKVFDSHLATRSLVTWNALLAGYGRLGDNKAVLRLFQGIQHARLKPDGVSFLSILTCCSHAGVLENAKDVFEAMSRECGINPSLEHYNCMVDILCRLNKMDEAMTLLHKMPWRPDTVTWMTVLGAGRKWKNVKIGRLAFEALAELDDTNPTAYVLMAQLYENRGMRKEQEMVLAMRKQAKPCTEAGQACWMNEEGEVEAHNFMVGR